MNVDKQDDQLTPPTAKYVRHENGEPMLTPDGTPYIIMPDPFEGKERSGDVQHILPINERSLEVLRSLALHSIEHKKRFPTQKILGILEFLTGEETQLPLQHQGSYGIFLTVENLNSADELMYVGNDWTNPEAWYVIGKGSATRIFIKNHGNERD